MLFVIQKSCFFLSSAFLSLSLSHAYLAQGFFFLWPTATTISQSINSKQRRSLPFYDDHSIFIIGISKAISMKYGSDSSIVIFLATIPCLFYSSYRCSSACVCVCVCVHTSVHIALILFSLSYFQYSLSLSLLFLYDRDTDKKQTKKNFFCICILFSSSSFSFRFNL